MKLKVLKSMLLITLGIPLYSWSQVTNTGSLYINSNTEVSSLQEINNTEEGDLINDGELLLYNHFINSGIVSFSPNKTTGTTRFVGTSNYQNIAGIIPMDWYNVVFNNTSNTTLPLPLLGQVNIFGNANFIKGIVDSSTNDGKIIFENGATTTNASDDSHVEGNVLKVGNEAFDFPIGHQNFYRKASISAPANSTDKFSLRYYLDTPDNLTAIPSNIETIDNQEYWVIQKESASSDVILTLSWDSSGITTPASIVEDPSQLHIMRWDEATNTWRDEAGVIDQTNQTISTPVNMTKYGIFTLAKAKTYPSTNEELVTIIFNGISSNNKDGLNDYFKINGLENTQNTVTIFNRWGAKVYETTNYNTTGNVFTGITEFKGLLGGNEMLPSGTYFYAISYTENGTGKSGRKVGYLYIN
jgi:gliding motility-associated-like protein